MYKVRFRKKKQVLTENVKDLPHILKKEGYSIVDLTRVSVIHSVSKKETPATALRVRAETGQTVVYRHRKGNGWRSGVYVGPKTDLKKVRWYTDEE